MRSQSLHFRACFFLTPEVEVSFLKIEILLALEIQKIELSFSFPITTLQGLHFPDPFPDIFLTPSLTFLMSNN